MDGGRTQAVSVRSAKGRERGLEGDFKELCEDTYTYSSRKPCSEIFPPPEQPQPPAPEIQSL